MTLRKLIIYLVLLIFAWCAAQHFVRPGMQNYRTTLARPAPATDTEHGSQLTVTWFGVATVLLSDGKHSLLIDPFFSRSSAFRTLLNLPIEATPSLAQAWLAQAGRPPINAILVSHSHYDHILDIGEVARASGATVFGSATSQNIAIGHGVPANQTQVIQTNTPYSIGPFTVTFIATPHAGATGGRPRGQLSEPLTSPARPWNYKLGATYAIHIAHARGNILHIGSAGLPAGALAGLAADIVLLGLAIRPPLAEYLKQTAYAVGADTVVPIHWDDFFRPLSNPIRPLAFGVRLDDFYATMRDQHPNIVVKSPPIGQPFNPFNDAH